MARKALGRGLETLIPTGVPGRSASTPTAGVVPVADAGAERDAGVREIPLDEILPNPFQPRRQFSQTELDELADSIRAHGVLQPLIVRRAEGGYQCVVGERRLRASKSAGLTAVPAVVREFTDREMLELAVVENAQREDLSPIESATAFKRLMTEFGRTQEQIAAAVGKSRSAIANTIRLLDLPAPIKDALAAGELTEGHARAVLTAGDAETMLAVWDRVAGTEASVREVERLARTLRERSGEPSPPARGRSAAPAPTLDPNLAALVDRLQRKLGTKVELKPRASGGTLVIEYYSDDDLNRLVDIVLGTPHALLD